MRKTADILTAILLTAIILVFGGGTALKVKGPVLDIIKSEAVTEMPHAIEESLTENFKSRNNWINVNGLFQRLIGVTVIRDAGDIDVFKMSNGQLTYEYPDCDMTYAAEEVTGLSELCKERGVEVQVIVVPVSDKAIWVWYGWDKWYDYVATPEHWEAFLKSPSKGRWIHDVWTPNNWLPGYHRRKRR